MNPNNKQTRTGLEIAVIGMSGRFPGAKNISRFWENLKKGIESISFFSDEELEKEGIQPLLLDNPDYVRAKGIVEEIEYFDSYFFDYTPKEAEIMDPQVRLFHECVWEALEDAAYNPGTYHGSIGLYAGASPNMYWEALTHLSGKNRDMGYFATLFNNDKDFLSLLISYKLNLKGPVVSFYTACSTSLVAVHLGCRALLTGECHMVLAGGVTIDLPQTNGYIYKEGMILSPDGHCRAFDCQANGTLSGNGVGVVVLKPLAAADAGGDHIYAVIKGSTVNNDGDQRLGFTAPSIHGQAEAVKRALHMAEVETESIHYIEAHGTGTPLGDPVEIEALKLALKSDKTGFCGIGSVKTNIGHLDCAAGIAGLIKAVLIVKHKVLPPSLHFESPNPKIDFENSPFYVNRTLKPLGNTPFPLRVGVSSFGMGGTNAHVVLEEWPGSQSAERTAHSEECMKHGSWSQGRGGVSPPEKSREYQLILLSAKTESALEKAAENLAGFLKENPRVNLADMAYTLQLGRKHFPWRRKFVCSGVSEAIEILTSTEPRKIQTFAANDENKTVVFMFPGLGPQYVNMGRQLYEKEPLFRQEMDRCFEILNGLVEYDLKEILYPSDRSDWSDRSDILINQTEIAQPLLFAFEYALAQLLMKWGIKPNAMIGYSLGEYTAACLSGVFSLEDALKIMVIRGELINGLPGGGMLSVPLPRDQLEPLVEEFAAGISIAIDNGPSCIVSGSENALAVFAGEMKKKKLVCLPLKASHGIHSSVMAPILKEFNQALAEVALKTPQIPYISNVTGTWIRAGEPADPTYWVTHLAETVRFAEGINQLLQQPNTIFIEVGPDRELCRLLANQPHRKDYHQAVNLVRPPQNNAPDLYYLLSKVGQLWLYGINIHWQAFYPGEQRHRLSLPTYPFERQFYPVHQESFGDYLREPVKDPQMVKKSDIGDWFYYPSWIRSQLSLKNPGSSTEPGCWLIFTLESQFCSLFIQRLKQLGHKVITVTMAEEFHPVKEDAYTLNPGLESDYARLLQALIREEKPSRIVHFWSMGGQETGEAEVKDEIIENALITGFYSMIYLAKALGKQNVSREVQLQVITHHLQEVTGEEVILPQQAPILGPLKVIPQEYPFIRCENVDILVPEPGSPEEAKLVDQLLVELTSETPDTDIAYRNHYRWVKTFRPIRFKEVEQQVPRLRENGVYLITGGMGRIGMTLASYLAQSLQARLILVGRSRSELPARDQWEQILASAGNRDTTVLKIRKLKQLEARGGQVLRFFTDVTDQAGMEAVISRAEERFGPINGVIHAAGHTRNIMQAIEHVTPAHCQQQFMPKIYGLLTLEKVLRGKKLDFCWLTSSLSPILGGLGFSAYSAANHFMDAFVKWYHRYHQSNPGNPVHWISVNWADWNFSPHPGKSPDRPGRNEQGEMNQEVWRMMPPEGIETFRRILSHCGAHQVVVSTVDLQTRLKRWVTMESIRGDQSQKPVTISYRSRPQLETSYVKPSNHIEQAIAEVLQDFLGIEEVGTNDNFFELGATSLNIIQINSIAREKLQLDISVMWWFEHPTVKTLSGYLLIQTMENPGEEPVVKVKGEKRVQAVKKGKTRLEQLKKRVTR
ncbi:MAG: SDR family NAD(P)-dependent oxidoreductase [Candidatus Aminicenantes bacterium]|nr:MAG: SDR family NAD(P)-dependent oxidoreductase [Candidatus Aminicenantes bacterium]